MNQQLVKFIELCLADGVISDKEREVIFRKSKEYGVPEDECEIILEGMIHSANKDNAVAPVNIPTNNLTKVSEQEALDILTLDSELLKIFEETLTKINERLILLDENPNLINKKFIEWLRSLDGRITKDETYPTLNYNDTILSNYNDIRKTGKCQITFFLPEPNMKYNGKNVIGKIILLDKRKFIFTNDVYAQERNVEVTKKNFWGSTIETKTEFVTIKKLDEINIFDEIESKIFKYLIWPFTRELNELHFNDILQHLKFQIEENNVNSLLKDVTPEKSEIVYKANSGLKKLLIDLKQYVGGLGLPIGYDFITYRPFTPYFMPLGSNSNYIKNQLFFQELDLLIKYIQFITSAIALRNDLILSLKKSDDNRFSYLKIQLDQMGLLMNYYESQSLSKLDQQIEVLQNGFNKLNNVLNEVIVSIDNLGESINKIDNSLDNMNHNLSNVNNNISFGNLLTAIQTYQIYKVNKNTKSLR